MFETKYHKPTVGSSRRLTKQFAKGGYVDPDVHTDADDADIVDKQMARNRLDSNASDTYNDSVNIIGRGGDRPNGRYSPERAIDNISAQGRIKTYLTDAEKDYAILNRKRKR